MGKPVSRTAATKKAAAPIEHPPVEGEINGDDEPLIDETDGDEPEFLVEGPKSPRSPDPVIAGYEEKIAALEAEVAAWKLRHQNAQKRRDAFNAIGATLQKLGFVAPAELRQ